MPGRRYVVCPTPQGTVPGARWKSTSESGARRDTSISTQAENIVDRAATHGASRIYLAHAGGAGFEDEPSKLLASLEERGFDARTASTDTSVGFESLDPFDVSLVEEQRLCSMVALAPPAPVDVVPDRGLR